MNETLKAMMLEAGRLTREGRLAEAAALIQRGLGVAASDCDPADSPDVIEGDFEVVDEAGSIGARFIGGHQASLEGRLDYKLYVPVRGACARFDEARPLILMLHGCGQDADQFAILTRMNVIADEMGFLVLYPTQARAANGAGCWNWPLIEHQKPDQGEPSLLAGMTRRVMASHGIDRRRVYVAGLSAGGVMAMTLAATHPDLFAAVGVHSGLPHASAQDALSALTCLRQGPTAPGCRIPPRPAIVFHGDADTTVHPMNAVGVIEQALGARPDASDGRIRSAEGRVPGGYAYTRTDYLDARGASRAELWLVHGGGHGWFGGHPLGAFAQPLGPDASREMARFFMAHPKPEEGGD
ncbi:alpha/beta hydrolase family esterase [Thiocystis violacea]|uniref:extracellular catalytic domain type 1 short-chain-length polyhydroxyalkanoate depolymerase n=1 Tax=Thiocystis violacea TaxID=13725 RepID=UPI0019051573|nr:PHB depolymerase family esterase [Thiocystis violacea]MBK1719397.1 hypothetical protein [Thiocystis violacea]